ncbi:hypothetical protein [Mucilaginibacter polytrichastri]|uniref:Lipoprotein n=1 Tax=Mucilaginibacter polytrichastri TaxID=1302689 RepID=A0A1Q5ZWY9_9SPHI|nr:hypothetical protein [Mucilaginibacter polytrichastri]OKS86228.1 hypothetical protein RG47T_1679 [Mucilaginibacter polytrichastri]SFT16105.1 hypothetical protein SAMN04487890_11388 [Mucilaginibacter polytrichastri]
MKKALLLLMAVTLLFTACKKDDISHQDAYEDSYKKFTAFKTSFSNSYSYVVSSASVFGPSTTTTITVNKGKVVSRSSKFYRRSEDGKSSVLFISWEEDESSVGTHKEGAEAITLDQVYDTAKNVWLKADKKTNKVYFETNADGLISSCGYVPDGCQDDCFSGISISSIAGGSYN